MTINYECLGRNDKIRKRRYEVLSFAILGATPNDIARIMNTTVRQTYNDLKFLYSNELHNIPLSIVKDLNKSAFEIKIRELESMSKQFKNNPRDYIGLQNIILKNREASLKLMGLMSEKVEHSGYMKLYDFSTDKYPDPETTSTNSIRS